MKLKLKIIISEIDKKERGWKAFQLPDLMGIRKAIYTWSRDMENELRGLLPKTWRQAESGTFFIICQILWGEKESRIFP